MIVLQQERRREGIFHAMRLSFHEPFPLSPLGGKERERCMRIRANEKMGLTKFLVLEMMMMERVEEGSPSQVSFGSHD